MPKLHGYPCLHECLPLNWCSAVLRCPSFHGFPYFCACPVFHKCTSLCGYYLTINTHCIDVHSISTNFACMSTLHVCLSLHKWLVLQWHQAGMYTHLCVNPIIVHIPLSMYMRPSYISWRKISASAFSLILPLILISPSFTLCALNVTLRV